MKKIFTICLVAFSVLVFAGCGNNSSSGGSSSDTTNKSMDTLKPYPDSSLVDSANRPKP